MLVINVIDKHNKVAKLPFYNRVLKDIKTYVRDVHYFEDKFINIVFLFCREVMTYTD